MVYVLDKDGSPLMPTEKHGYVRRLLKEEKAKVESLRPFTIRLLYEVKGEVQPVILGIDPGRTNIGLCTVREDGKPFFTARCRTRNKEVPKLIAKRREFRQAHRKHARRERRQRRAMANMTALKGGTIERHLPSYGEDKNIVCKVIRNKEARFSNRRRPEGWITPTARQLLQTHLNLVRKISGFMPVSKIILELNRFAFMRMDDPSTVGRMFQRGPLFGYDGSVRSAIWNIQEGKCLLCGKPIEQYHHVRERRKDGSEAVRNRVGLCRCCHRLVHTDTVAAGRLGTLAAGQRKRYDAVGVLNQIVPYLMEGLSQEYELSVTAGWQTKEFRDASGMPKDHHLDAYVIACSELRDFKLQVPDGYFQMRQFRRHDRQACKREMLNRDYVLNGKIVARNRHKAFGQKEDSLKEYVEAGGRTDRLVVKHTRKTMKDMERHYPGSQMVHDGRIRTVMKRAQGYYWFDDGTKATIRKSDINRNNIGLIFVSNMEL